MRSQRSHGLVEETRRICAASYPYCSPLFRYGHQTAEKGLKKAYGKFFKGVRASKDMFERWQIKHYISCFEITHGINGFHPHYHVLLFVPYSLGKQSLPGIKQDMYKVWKDCCLKAGLDEPSEKHGLDLQAGNEAGAYVAKWGLEHEMTKGHIKRARKITAPRSIF